MKEERRAYYVKNYTKTGAVNAFFRKYNHHVKTQLNIKQMQYAFLGLANKFENITTVNNAVGTLINGKYIWKDIM